MAAAPAVLIVGDDDPATRQVAAVLESHGCRVWRVETASDALERCRSRRFDIVVSRVLFLNGISGVELVRNLRGSASEIVLCSPFPEHILTSIEGFPPAGIPFFRIPADLDRLVATALAAAGWPAESIKRSASVTRSVGQFDSGAWEIDLETNTVRLSCEFYELFGIAPRRDVQALESLEDRVYPDDRDVLRRAFEDAVANGRQLYRERFRVMRPDGSIHWLCASGKIDYDAAGHPIRARGVTVYESEDE